MPLLRSLAGLIGRAYYKHVTPTELVPGTAELVSGTTELVPGTTVRPGWYAADRSRPVHYVLAIGLGAPEERRVYSKRTLPEHFKPQRAVSEWLGG